MSIDIKCPCGSDYRLDDSRAGQQFTCRVCGATMELPAGVGRATPQAAAEQPSAAATASADVATGSQASAWGESMGQSLGAPLGSAGPVATPTPNLQPRSHVVSPPGQASSPSWSPVFRTSDAAWEAPADPQRPPMSWCAVRLILWGLCAGFLFMPWFTLSGANQQSGEVVSKSLTGYAIVKGVAEGFAQAGAAGVKIDGGALGQFANAPEGGGAVLAGGVMMLVGPCVYGLGLVLAAPLGLLAYVRGGRGMLWPFAVTALGLIGFIVGWRMIAGAEPFSHMLDVANQVGVSIGASAWAWAMALAMIPLCLIAKAKPDYNLLQAMKWSEERSGASGPF